MTHKQWIQKFSEFEIIERNVELEKLLPKKIKELDKQLVENYVQHSEYLSESHDLLKNLRKSTGYFLPSWWQEERLRLTAPQVKRLAIREFKKNKEKELNKSQQQQRATIKMPTDNFNSANLLPPLLASKKSTLDFNHQSNPSILKQHNALPPITTKAALKAIKSYLPPGDAEDDVLVDAEPTFLQLERTYTTYTTVTTSEIVPINRHDEEDSISDETLMAKKTSFTSLGSGSSPTAATTGETAIAEDLVEVGSADLSNGARKKSFAELTTTTPAWASFVEESMKSSSSSSTIATNHLAPISERGNTLKSVRRPLKTGGDPAAAASSSSSHHHRSRKIQFEEMLNDIDMAKWVPDYKNGYPMATGTSHKKLTTRLLINKKRGAVDLTARHLADTRELRAIAEGRYLNANNSQVKVHLTETFGRRFLKLMQKPNYGLGDERGDAAAPLNKKKFRDKMDKFRNQFPTLHELHEEDIVDLGEDVRQSLGIPVARRQITKIPFKTPILSI